METSFQTKQRTLKKLERHLKQNQKLVSKMEADGNDSMFTEIMKNQHVLMDAMIFLVREKNVP